jgi:hypothetical protein
MSRTWFRGLKAPYVLFKSSNAQPQDRHGLSQANALFGVLEPIAAHPLGFGHGNFADWWTAHPRLLSSSKTATQDFVVALGYSFGLVGRGPLFVASLFAGSPGAQGFVLC